MLRPGDDGPLAGTGYRPLHRIGAGGMGEVFEADRDGERVVVKVMHPSHIASPELVDRMRIEGEILAKLRHPNLVAVHQFGCTSEGRPFIAMEKLVGRTLRDEVVARGALPAEEAVEIVGQMLAALDALHRAGVIHRDLKPANVFVCPQADGCLVKLLDLGIAKMLDGAAERTGITPPEFRTREGAWVGTPTYAAPEQALGGKIDARTDVYGAGLVLYALLTGRGPFDGCKGLNLGRALEPPSHRAANPIPDELDAVVLKALATHPNDRYQTAAEFGAALAAIARSLTTPKGWVQTHWFDLALFQQRISGAPGTQSTVEHASTEPDTVEPATAVRDDGSLTPNAARGLIFHSPDGRGIGVKEELPGVEQAASSGPTPHAPSIGGRGDLHVAPTFGRARFALVLVASAAIAATLCVWLLLHLTG